MDADLIDKLNEAIAKVVEQHSEHGEEAQPNPDESFSSFAESFYDFVADHEEFIPLIGDQIARHIYRKYGLDHEIPDPEVD